MNALPAVEFGDPMNAGTWEGNAFLSDAIAAAVALASLAWSGHGAASEGFRGTVHLVADIVHLLAAGVWVGPLFALGLLLFRCASSMTADHLLLATEPLRASRPSARSSLR